MKHLVPQNEQQVHLVQILLAKMQGVPVEYKIIDDGLRGEWSGSGNGHLLDWKSYVYRIKQKEPLTLPKEFWRCILRKWRYVAMDKDGEFFLYGKKPKKDTISKLWETDRYGDLCKIDLNIDTTGYEWDETLIERPEGV